MADAFLLDTSAVFAFLENEAGADVVEKLLLDAKAGQVALFASFATLVEVEYIITQERTAADADAALDKIKGWPVQWYQTDEMLCSGAAKLKAAHKISFADSFVAATAQQVKATLVHKDPEFEVLRDRISLHPLPMRNA